MRYHAIAQLREGMVLASTIYGDNFGVFMVEGTVMGASHISRLNLLGYPGAYVKDDDSEGIEAVDVLSGELRIKAVKATADMLGYAESAAAGKPGKMPKNFEKTIVAPMVDSIIASRHRVVDLIDLKPFDSSKYFHSANVAALSLLIGVELGLSGRQLHDLGLAALLHDVGDIFIPDEILEKPGKLTEQEREIVKQHTDKGFEFVREVLEMPIDACVGVFQHHENYDGTGYPGKLRGDKISVLGRIIAVTEVFDAMISRRPFREAMYPPAAMEFANYHSGTMFDPEIVRTLAQVVSPYPVGVCVELSTKVRCLVVQNYAGALQRPKVRMMNSLSKTPLHIDLKNDPKFKDTRITGVLDV